MGRRPKAEDKNGVSYADYKRKKYYNASSLSLKNATKDLGIDLEELDLLKRKLGNLKECAQRLSIGWNEENAVKYYESQERLMKEIVYLEYKYSIIVVLQDHILTNTKAKRSVYYYSISHVNRYQSTAGDRQV